MPKINLYLYKKQPSAEKKADNLAELGKRPIFAVAFGVIAVKEE